MRALFSIASLLIVLCVVMVAVQHQLHASRQFLPGGATAKAGASAPFGANHPDPSQYQRELERALKDGAALRAGATETAETSR